MHFKFARLYIKRLCTEPNVQATAYHVKILNSEIKVASEWIILTLPHKDKCILPLKRSAEYFLTRRWTVVAIYLYIREFFFSLFFLRNWIRLDFKSYEITYDCVTFFGQGNDVNKWHVLFPSWNCKNLCTVYHISSHFYGYDGRLYRNEASICLDLFLNIKNWILRQLMLVYHDLICQVSKITGIFTINTAWPSLCQNMQPSLISG